MWDQVSRTPRACAAAPLPTRRRNPRANDISVALPGAGGTIARVLRFLHTADWQLGMTRRYLGPDAQARFAQARLDAITRIGDVARAHACAFVTVAGDAFDSNLVERQVVLRALELLAQVPCPVLLLPGNHDAFDGVSVYRTPEFVARRPPNVHVLAGESAVFTAVPGVEVVGVPWPSRKPARDLLAEALRGLGKPGRARVVVAHGRTDAFRPARREAATITTAAVEAALDQRLLHYLALGDRHSFAPVGDSGRVFYAGTPEPTDFDEQAPGHVAVVTLDAKLRVQVEPVAVGTWRFVRHRSEVSAAADVERLHTTLAALPHKDRTVLRVELAGELDFAAWSALDACLSEQRELFAALDRIDGELTLAAGALRQPTDLAGWPAAAARQLAERARHEPAARDALLLLHRLTRAAAP
jgi:DNA repair exonuclease SbcCD nuclease subunit